MSLLIGVALALLPIQVEDLQLQDPGPEANLTYESIVSELEGDQIIYHLNKIHLQTGVYEVRADYVMLRFDRERYAEVQKSSALIGDFASALLGLPGQPATDTLILELRMEGNVYIDTGVNIIRCQWLGQLPQEGMVTMHKVDITVPAERSPSGWPWRMQAEYLQEFPDGRLRARKTLLTACHLQDPLYGLAMKELHGTPDGTGEYYWSPSAPWLEINHRRILPMPAFDFYTGAEDGGFGLRSLRISSGRQLGTAIDVGFAASTKVGNGHLNWRLLPTFSTRRGFPLRSLFDYKSKDYQARWDLFALNDQADDIHALKNYVARENDFRWRARLDNRWLLEEDWRLDLDFAATSDALVDPEFFRQDWVREDDALTEFYLRKVTDDSHFSVRALYRLDPTGFTPLGGYTRGGGPGPQQLDMLPRVQYERFSSAIADFSSGAFGGADRKSQLNFSYGFDLGRFQLRDVGVEVPGNRTPFEDSGTMIRDRAMAWAEFAAPMNLGGLSFRPGLRIEAGAINDPSRGGGDNLQSSAEIFLDTSAIFERRSEDFWTHRVRPMLRLRDLRVFQQADATWYPFEGFRWRRPGKAAEISVRQFWYGDDLNKPWLDLNIMVPYYLDENKPLTDGVFPSLRAGQPFSSWGPGEMRLAWDPGIERGFLRGVRSVTNLRYRFDLGRIEERFTQLSVNPSSDFQLSINQRQLNQPESPLFAFRNTSVNMNWRINETFEITLGRTFRTSKNSGTSSRYGFTYHGQGFGLEFYTARNDVTGESRYGVNILPCFLTDPYHGNSATDRRAL
jgi:hypothetical protein